MGSLRELRLRGRRLKTPWDLEKWITSDFLCLMMSPKFLSKNEMIL